jgi:O-antigen/teichoic acid export membrane protein
MVLSLIIFKYGTNHNRKMSNDAIKSIAKGALWMFLGFFLAKILSYFYRIVIARIGTYEYGLLSLMLAVFGIFTAFALLGLNYGVVRYVAFYQGKKDDARTKGTILSSLKIALPWSIVLAFGLYISSDLIAVGIFNEPNLSLLLKIISFALPLEVTKSLLLKVAKGFKKIEYMVYVKDITEGVAKIILTLIFLYIGLAVYGAALAYTCALFICALLALYFLEWRIFPIFRSKTKSINETKKLFKYSWPMLFSDFLFLIVLWTDTFMLGYFKTIADVGIYNAASPTAQLMFVVPSAIASMFFPVLSGLYAKKEMSDFKVTYKVINKWIYAINIMVAILFVVFARQILNILFGSEYAIGAIAFIILTVGYFLSSLSWTAKTVLIVMKETKFILFLSLLGAGLNIILNFFLIPDYSLAGAAIASAISFIVVTIATIIYTYKVSKINPFDFTYLKVLLSALVAGVAMWFLQGWVGLGGILSLVVGSSLFVAIYLGMLLITKSFEEKDKMIFKTIKDKIFGEKSDS